MVHDDSDGPDIHFIGMPLSLEDLRRDVIWRAADSFLLLLVILQPRGQSEIPQLDLHILIQEQISQLKTA